MTSMTGRYEWPLTTGLTKFIRFHDDEAGGFKMCCYEDQVSAQPRFEIPLDSARFVNVASENGPCLLISSSAGDFEFQCYQVLDCNLWKSILTSMGCKEVTFHELYKITHSLGEGSFAKVYTAKCTANGEEVVVKVVSKRKQKVENMLTEMKVMRSIHHPNIIKLSAAFDRGSQWYLVTEYLRGGEVFDWVAEKGGMSEDDARLVMRRIFSALTCLHEHGFIHRDLKTENLTLARQGDLGSVKLIDFGLATDTSGKSASVRCGSPGYVAPEVLEDRKYGTKVDLFSAGVILYILLAGYPPFVGSSVKEILRKNYKCQLNFRTESWRSRSHAARALIRLLCSRDPESRPTAAEALNHEWFKLGSGEEASPQSKAPTLTPEHSTYMATTTTFIPFPPMIDSNVVTSSDSLPVMVTKRRDNDNSSFVTANSIDEPSLEQSEEEKKSRESSENESPFMTKRSDGANVSALEGEAERLLRKKATEEALAKALSLLEQRRHARRKPTAEKALEAVDELGVFKPQKNDDMMWRLMSRRPISMKPSSPNDFKANINTPTLPFQHLLMTSQTPQTQRSSSFAHAAMAFEDRISKLPRPSEVHRTRRAMSMTSQALDHEVLFVSPLVFKRRTSSASSLFTGSSNGLRSAADSWESLQNRQDVISGHATLNAESRVASKPYRSQIHHCPSYDTSLGGSVRTTGSPSSTTQNSPSLSSKPLDEREKRVRGETRFREAHQAQYSTKSRISSGSPRSSATSRNHPVTSPTTTNPACSSSTCLSADAVFQTLGKSSYVRSLNDGSNEKKLSSKDKRKKEGL